MVGNVNMCSSLNKKGRVALEVCGKCSTRLEMEEFTLFALDVTSAAAHAEDESLFWLEITDLKHA